MTKITCTLNVDLCTFITEFRLILLRIRNFFDKFAKKKIKTHFLRSITFFPENRATNKIMWQNIVQQDRPQMTKINAQRRFDFHTVQ